MKTKETFEIIVKRIGPLSPAKIGGITHAVLGFIIGIFHQPICPGGLFGSASFDGGMRIYFRLLLGPSAIIFLPVVYGILGFIMGILVASLTNIFAGLVGGVELEVQ